MLLFSQQLTGAGVSGLLSPHTHSAMSLFYQRGAGDSHRTAASYGIISVLSYVLIRCKVFSIEGDVAGVVLGAEKGQEARQIRFMSQYNLQNKHIVHLKPRCARKGPDLGAA